MAGTQATLKLVRTQDAEPSPRATRARAPVRGTLEDITPEGFVLVSWGGATKVRAAIAADASHQALLRAIEARAPVLLEFLDGDPAQPVIIGLLRDRLDVDVADPRVVTEHLIELSASHELSLRCGESAVELHQDGRVVIRGTDIQSVSTGTNAIKGAYVELN
jgi:hypothetical protein